MATYTPNYNLEKPAQTDIYNIDVFNANADKIDAALGEKADQTMLAPVESSNVASQNYAVGAYFVYNGYLCRATSAISMGSTIAIGTNCASTAAGTELKSIKDALSYSFPDYTGTKLHTFATNDRWTAPRDCMLVGYVVYETSQGGYDSAVKVNNVTVATAYNSTGNLYVGVTVPVREGGIVITASKGDFTHLFAY